MKAIILAGGKGKRLAPYSTILPKPLMPLGDMPILEVILRQLKSHQITDIVLSVGYLGGLLEAYFGNGEKLGVNITYSYEPEPLGTAGPLALVSELTETFFVVNGDLLTTLDFTEMLRFHREHGQWVTLGLADKPVKIDLGVIETGEQGRLVKYIEKPTLNYKVSMGIYVFEPAVLSYVRGAGRLDLPDLMLRLMNDQKEVRTFSSGARWLDIGRVEDYSLALEIFENERGDFLK
jgi:NDP-sugar pyrophosphorylase family protein